MKTAHDRPYRHVEYLRYLFIGKTLDIGQHYGQTEWLRERFNRAFDFGFAEAVAHKVFRAAAHRGPLRAA